MTAIMAVLAVAIAIVVAAAIFTALDVFLALSVEKTARRESLLCETKKFESMTTKKFAKECAGQYFMYGDKKVRVVGYHRRGRDTFLLVTGIGGWEMKYTENRPDYVFTARVQASRVYYVKLKDLKL